MAPPPISTSPILSWNWMEGNILLSPALVIQPTDLMSTFSVCTRRVFGGIGHRTRPSGLEKVYSENLETVIDTSGVQWLAIPLQNTKLSNPETSMYIPSKNTSDSMLRCLN
ncbi:hypothetical protein TNCV_3371581 [Trichonephila clavipes]|nr:hypothetical protein TNCV_3371581 [Trichonephila clavipes]